MALCNQDTLKSAFVPGGIIFVAAGLLLRLGILSPSASLMTVLYWGISFAGVLLALRFRSSRTLFSFLSLLLAHYALEFFSGGRPALTGPGQTAVTAVALLLPLNFSVLSIRQERGLTMSSLRPLLTLLFAEFIFLAVVCRPGQTSTPSLFNYEFLPPALFHWTRIPQLGWLALVIGSVILFIRLDLGRKPIESGLIWALASAFLGLQSGGGGKMGTAYFAVSSLVLVFAIVENSYFLAYHDDLTALPARRAFNDAMLTLPEHYTLAMVDIDHFKSFNDSYGHDTGDQVLRMVAAKLARVSGGGRAFRLGGEEFAILFGDEPLSEALPHLEILRMEIEATAFRVRTGRDRRMVSHGTDRRKPVPPRRRARPRPKPFPAKSAQLSVTVSIGVAEPKARLRQPAQVLQAADKALYRAKQSGRNRVEIALSERLKRSIA